MFVIEGNYSLGPAVTLAVGASSVSFLSGSVKPTSGKNQGKQAEIVLIKAIGPLYMDCGTAATTASYPRDTDDEIVIEGYENIRELTFIRNTNSTSVVALFGYR